MWFYVVLNNGYDSGLRIIRGTCVVVQARISSLLSLFYFIKTRTLEQSTSLLYSDIYFINKQGIMSVMNDAQRLVSMSLGKLACSRSQRGGPQLRKALLLSTVLHKAREAFMYENKTAILSRQHSVDEPRILERQQTVEEPEEEPCSPAPVEPEAVPEPESGSPVKRQRTTDDKENCTPDVPCAYEGPLPGGNKDSTTTTVSKCEKRRSSEETESEECPDKKRPRLGARQLEDNDNTTKSSSKHEPMDCLQISSLVNRFNSGLSGLSGCLSAKLESENQDENTRTSSKNTFNCRTVQVKEGFESMNRAVHTITV